MTNSTEKPCDSSSSHIAATLSAMTPELHQQFLHAIEIGRWPNGQKLSDEQRATCLEAIIIYEHQHVEETQRTGFVPPKKTPCDTHEATEDTLQWKN